MKAHFPSVMLVLVGLISLALAIGCGSPDQAASTPDDQEVAEPDHGHEHAGAVDPHDVPLTDEQKEQLKADTAKFADAIAESAMTYSEQVGQDYQALLAAIESGGILATPDI